MINKEDLKLWQNPICISTGCVYKLSDDKNDLIEELSKLFPMGIEISFAHPESLLSFNVSKNNLEYLRSLKFNSIHAPCKDIIYGRNKMSEKALQKISELYKQIDARNVVFHKDQIEDYGFIESSSFLASIENDDWRKSKHSIEDMQMLFNQNKEFKFTFDFAHALSVSSADIPKYIQCFKNRLIEIHLSIIDKGSEKHEFLHKYDNTEIRKLLQLLKSFFVPVVLEGVVSSLTEMKLLEKEIEYLMNL